MLAFRQGKAVNSTKMLRHGREETVADVRNRLQIAIVFRVRHITYSLFYVDAVIDDLSIRP
ncbi:hypothetical protein, partial [Acidithiobacillus caldus]|uniref:hypothetical protein n=1 Tax=Acidithiobacillus caldus TaxID=33059 RepID=UPI001CF3820B